MDTSTVGSLENWFIHGGGPTVVLPKWKAGQNVAMLDCFGVTTISPSNVLWMCRSVQTTSDPESATSNETGYTTAGIFSKHAWQRAKVMSRTSSSYLNAANMFFLFKGIRLKKLEMTSTMMGDTDYLEWAHSFQDCRTYLNLWFSNYTAHCFKFNLGTKEENFVLVILKWFY